METLSLAEEAYQAYTATTGNKNYRGEECPAFKDLPEQIKQAWEAAAGKVEDLIRSKFFSLTLE